MRKTERKGDKKKRGEGLREEDTKASEGEKKKRKHSRQKLTVYTAMMHN